MANYKFGINEPPHRRWPVAWYNPSVLMRSARELMSTGDQIRNLDRRELFTRDFAVVDLSQHNESQDFWWDFMSDSGDSGNASYTVARAMQSPGIKTLLQIANQKTTEHIQIPAELPRGNLMVLGGDLAYPGASMEEYQYRFIELWEAAKSTTGTSAHTLLAIPQNHDWFDNISTFHRYFIGNHDSQVLTADTPQTRSYFATRLPHDWWILGLDFALVGDLDRSQYEVFLKLLENKIIAPNANVILLYPEPYWTRSLGDDAGVGLPRRYQRLEAALLNHGVKIRMRLAGDLHHYVRETASPDTQTPYEDMLITCGSGGAFLHPTHTRRVKNTKIMDTQDDQSGMTPDLQKRVRVGLPPNKKAAQDKRPYDQKKYYPDRTTSKKLARWNLIALFKPAAVMGLFTHDENKVWYLRMLDNIACLAQSLWSGNIMFPLLFGFIYWLAVYCNSFVFSDAFLVNGFVPASEIGNLELSDFLTLWLKALFFSPLALAANLLLLALCIGAAAEDGRHSKILGAFHCALQLVAVAILFWATSKLTPNPYHKGAYLFLAAVATSGLLFGGYLWAMSRLGFLTNNAFSALGHEGYKGFLRFRIDPQGNLHGYMIGSDKVPKRWKFNPDATRPLWVEKFDNEAPDWRVRDVFVLKK